MDFLQENKDLYTHEIEYSYQKNGKLEVYLTLITILGTGEIILVKEIFPVSICCWWWYIYTSLIIISSILFISCIEKLYTAFNAYPYSYINLSEINKECSKFKKDLITHNCSQDTIDDAVKQVFYKMLSEMYFTCAMQNRNTNIQKQKNHENFIKTFVISLISFMVSFLFNIIIVNIKGGTIYVK